MSSSLYSLLGRRSPRFLHCSLSPRAGFILVGGGTPLSPRNRSALVVLVVAAPPDARLVASPGGAVEPLVHAPEAVQSARIGGIGVVDDAVLGHERAHARSLARVRGHIGYGHDRILGNRSLAAFRQ